MEKIMSLSPAEFHHRLSRLCQALPDTELRTSQDQSPGGHYTVSQKQGKVAITCDPLPPLSLGPGLSLPRCRITFTFEGMSLDNQKRFLARFDLAFRKGGG